MGFCKKCGNKSQKDSKSCNTCGSELEKLNNKKTSSIKDKHNFSDNHKTFYSDHSLKNKEEPLEIIKNVSFIKRLKENKFLAIIILLLIAVGITFSINPIKNLFIRKNTSNWLVYAANKSQQVDTLDTISDLKIKFQVSSQEIMNYKNVEDIVEQCTLRVKGKTNKKTDEKYDKVSLIYRGKEILNGEIYSNKEYIAISMPQLYKDTMYIQWKDINKLIKDNSKEDINHEDKINPKNYKTVLNIKNSKYYDSVNKDYEEFFKKVMEPYIKKGDKVDVSIKNQDKEKTIKCNEVLVHLDNEKIIEILKVFLQKVSKDDNLKLLVKDKVFQFINTAEKNEDLHKFDINKNKADEIKKDFDSKYDSFMRDIGDTKKIDKKGLGAKVNSLSKVRIDSKNYIRGLKSEISIEEKTTSFNVILDTVVNSINSSLDIKTISKEKAKDISKFTQEDIDNINKEVGNNIEKIIFRNFNTN
ncbi:zinc ribbon domain-containing protein [Clostridium botulinum]|nr:zinc ribbon domain-containing protein [Clostridium botulinum]